MNLASVDTGYILNNIIFERNVGEIPIKTTQYTKMYKNINTFNLIEKHNYDSDISKVKGFEQMKKFNPQDTGMPH